MRVKLRVPLRDFIVLALKKRLYSFRASTWIRSDELKLLASKIEFFRVAFDKSVPVKSAFL